MKWAEGTKALERGPFNAPDTDLLVRMGIFTGSWSPSPACIFRSLTVWIRDGTPQAA